MQLSANNAFQVIFPKYAQMFKQSSFGNNDQSLQTFIRDQLPGKVQLVRSLDQTFSTFLNQFGNLILKRPRQQNLIQSLLIKATQKIDKYFHSLELSNDKNINKNSLQNQLSFLNFQQLREQFRNKLKQMKNLLKEKYFDNYSINRSTQEQVAKRLYHLNQMYYFMKNDLSNIASRFRLKQNQILTIVNNSNQFGQTQSSQIHISDLIYFDKTFIEHIYDVVSKRCRPFLGKKDFFYSKLKQIQNQSQSKVPLNINMLIGSIMSKQKYRITKQLTSNLAKELKTIDQSLQEQNQKQCKQIISQVDSLKKQFNQLKNNAYYLDIVRGSFAQKYKMQVHKLQNVYYLSNIQKYLQDIATFTERLIRVQEKIISNRKDFMRKLGQQIEQKIVNIITEYQIKINQGLSTFSEIVNAEFQALQNSLYGVIKQDYLNKTNSNSQFKQTKNRKLEQAQQRRRQLQYQKQQRQKLRRQQIQQKAQMQRLKRQEQKIKLEQKRRAQEQRIRKMKQQRQEKQRLRLMEQNQKDKARKLEMQAKMQQKRQKDQIQKQRMKQQIRRKQQQKRIKQSQDRQRRDKIKLQKQQQEKRKKQQMQFKKQTAEQQKLKKQKQKKQQEQKIRKQKQQKERLQILAREQKQIRSKKEIQDKQRQQKQQKQKKIKQERQKQQREKQAQQAKQRRQKQLKKEQQERKLRQKLQREKLQKQNQQKIRSQKQLKLKQQNQLKRKLQQQQRQRQLKRQKQIEQRQKKDKQQQKIKQKLQRQRKQNQQRERKQNQQRQRLQRLQKQQKQREKNQKQKKQRQRRQIQQRQRKQKEDRQRKQRQERQRKQKEQQQKRQKLEKQRKQKQKQQEQKRQRQQRQKKQKQQNLKKQKQQRQRKLKQQNQRKERQKRQLQELLQQQQKNKAKTLGNRGKQDKKGSGINYNDFDDICDDDLDEINNKQKEQAQKQVDQDYLNDYDDDFQSPQKQQGQSGQIQGGQIETKQLITEQSIKCLNQYLKGTSYYRKNKPNLQPFNNSEYYSYLFQQFTQSKKMVIFQSEYSNAILEFSQQLLNQDTPQDQLKQTVESIREQILNYYTAKVQFQDFHPVIKLVFIFSIENQFDLKVVEISLNPHAYYFRPVFGKPLAQDQQTQVKFNSLLEAFMHIFQLQNEPAVQPYQISQQSMAVISTFDKQLPCLLTIFAMYYQQTFKDTIKITQYTVERFFYSAQVLKPLYQQLTNKQEQISQFYGKLFQNYAQNQEINVIPLQIQAAEQNYDKILMQHTIQVKNQFLQNKQKITLIMFQILIREQSDQDDQADRVQKVIIYCSLEKTQSKPVINYFIINKDDTDQQNASSLFDIISQGDQMYDVNVYTDFTRHNGLNTYSEWILPLWARSIQKRKLSPIQAFRAITFSMAPLFIAYKQMD